MRVYVAAALSEHLLAEYCATLMALHGAHIVSTWHQEMTKRMADAEPVEDPPSTDGLSRARIATKCLQEVKSLQARVDRFVCVFTDRTARGTYVELGAALAGGVPVVLLNRCGGGASVRHSVFDSHPLVQIVYDVREMLEAVFHPHPLDGVRERAPTEPDTDVAEALPDEENAS